MSEKKKVILYVVFNTLLIKGTVQCLVKVCLCDQSQFGEAAGAVTLYSVTYGASKTLKDYSSFRNHSQ